MVLPTPFLGRQTGRELEGATGSDISSPLLEETCQKKEEQIQQIRDVKTQIQKISNEIAGYVMLSPSSITVDENDLSLRNFEEYQKQLQVLQKEKVRSATYSTFIPFDVLQIVAR